MTGMNMSLATKALNDRFPGLSPLSTAAAAVVEQWGRGPEPAGIFDFNATLSASTPHRAVGRLGQSTAVRICRPHR